MRSRSTNILQIFIIFAALSYIVIGLSCVISPVGILRFFAENVSENWLDLVRDNELIAPLYYLTRGFAILLLTTGIAMVLPLFDPLRYRGLLYYNGLIFPGLSSILFLKNGIFYLFLKQQPGKEVTGTIVSQSSGHLILLVLGILFFIISALFLIGLMITKKQTKAGKE